MDSPPERDSPKHILNALNPDCFEAIFRRISGVIDFLQAAQVCQQFQQSAKLIFHSKFQGEVLSYDGITITQPKYRNRRIHIVKNIRLNSIICVPFNLVDAFLSIFGSQLQYLCVESTSDKERDDKLFESIANFAGKSLKMLIMRGLEVDFEQTQFVALEHLELIACALRNFNRCSQLISLKMHFYDEIMRENDTWLIQHMPHLVSVRLHGARTSMDDIIGKFLSLNPQIERLWVIQSGFVLPMLLENICTYLPDLVELKVDGFGCSTSLLLLGRLKKLRHFEYFEADSMDLVINILARGNAPIEILRLQGNRFSGENLLTISTLKTVELMSTMGKLLSEPLALLKTQPALERLQFTNERGVTSMLDLEKQLKYGKNLKYFNYSAYRVTGDLASYESLLRTAQNRHVYVCISSTAKIDVPETILEANSKFLILRSD